LVNQGYDGKFIRRCMITYLIVIDFIALAFFSLSGYLTANLFPLFSPEPLRFGVSYRGDRRFFGCSSVSIRYLIKWKAKSIYKAV
jgi:hypothetical protein